MEEEKRVQWYQNALYLLPEHLQRAARSCSKAHQAEAEELRLRMGQPLSLLALKERFRFLKNQYVPRICRLYWTVPQNFLHTTVRTVSDEGI